MTEQAPVSPRQPVGAPTKALENRCRPIERIVVVVNGLNPSFDYYLRPRVFHPEAPAAELLDLKNPPSRHFGRKCLAGSFVLFCRYTSAAWLGAIERCGDQIGGVGAFLDDDVEALLWHAGVPLAYRLRLAGHFLLHRRRLFRHLNFLWVSTPRLRAKYSVLGPRVLSPLAGSADEPRPRAPGPRLRVAFHSTAAHGAEHGWLAQVLRPLAAEPLLNFEVVADPRHAPAWRAPGIEILAPTRWPEYRTATRERGADLLLAPLLPGSANAARAPTKRIDAMRLGAALLVNDPEIYRPDAEERSLGMCVPLEPAAWRDAIRALARDPARLARLRDLNRLHVQRWSAECGPLLEAQARC